MGKQQYGPKKGLTVAKADDMNTEKTRYVSKKQSDVDTTSKQSAARKRHDESMRSSGRKNLATNYGQLPGDKKKKK